MIKEGKHPNLLQVSPYRDHPQHSLTNQYFKVPKLDFFFSRQWCINATTNTCVPLHVVASPIMPCQTYMLSPQSLLLSSFSKLSQWRQISATTKFLQSSNFGLSNSATAKRHHQDLHSLFSDSSVHKTPPPNLIDVSHISFAWSQREPNATIKLLRIRRSTSEKWHYRSWSTLSLSKQQRGIKRHHQDQTKLRSAEAQTKNATTKISVNFQSSINCFCHVVSVFLSLSSK